jgi:N-acetylglucosaminyldiphosphoundecaprenol N-acetyl-beta-D-mannosaminyltransferase
MKNSNVEILNIQFVNKLFNEVVQDIAKRISKKEKTFIVTANPEIVMYAEEHPNYKKIIQSADLIVPDGAGIVLASKILRNPIRERVAGFDLTIRLLQLAVTEGWSIFLLGGKPEVNQKAAQRIKVEFPGIDLAGHHHGYFDMKDKSLTEKIRSVKPDIILVALGFPKQEKWISANIECFEKGVFMGVGGTVDILAGEAKRAPFIWRKLNLEWLYRLLSQPARWKRMLVLPEFVGVVLREKKKNI